jgi:hypothetical protein
MPHIHWVARQNKLEIPKDKDEVNKQDIHDCDGRAHDPDTMVSPPTPKSTRKAEVFTRAPPTIVLSREEDASLRKWPNPLPLIVVSSSVFFFNSLLFIIRVKRELKRVYKNGCRYNERLNTETGGSKTSHTHWVARVNI